MQRMRVSHLFGSVVVLSSLVFGGEAWPRERADAAVFKVVLPHRCSQREQMNRGDGREIFIRYEADHSGFVNQDFMPVENDLRRSIAATMATRREQVIYFSADESLPYAEIVRVLNDLRKDDADLWIILVTGGQRAELDQAPKDRPMMLCLAQPTV